MLKSGVKQEALLLRLRRDQSLKANSSLYSDDRKDPEEGKTSEEEEEGGSSIEDEKDDTS
jgi:hypothetical protein